MRLYSFLGAAPVALAARWDAGITQVECFVGERIGYRELDALSGMPLSADELEVFTNEVQQMRRHIAETPGAYNEIRISPVTALVRTTGVLSMRAHTTDYATYAVARRWWGRFPDRSRVARLASSSPGLDPLLACGVGVSLAVITTDGCIAVSRRPASDALWPTHVQASVSEGSFFGDLYLDGGQMTRWNPQATFARGLHEELGVAAAPEVRVTALITEVSTGTVSLLGHVLVPYTLAELTERAAAAPDAAEITELTGIPWDLARLGEWATVGRWVPWAAATVALAVADVAGWAVLERAGLVVAV